MEFTVNLYNVIEIALLLAACFACYGKGKIDGIGDTIEELLDREIISLKDLEKLEP